MEMIGSRNGALLLKRAATIADHEESSDRRAQIIDGDLWSFAPPTMDHQVASMELGTLLAPERDRVDGTGWVILPSIGLKLGPRNVFLPDLAGWRRTRMPTVPDVTYCELAPDWVCEVMSSSTRPFDLGKKREVYATARVRHWWFIEPTIQTVSIFELVGSGYQLIGSAQEDDRIALAPFLDLTLDLSKLWRR
jgi:Uma2 family endonuclease